MVEAEVVCSISEAERIDFLREQLRVRWGEGTRMKIHGEFGRYLIRSGLATLFHKKVRPLEELSF